MTDYTAYDQHLPCKNSSCPSYGTPHPNCACYSDGGLVLEHHLAHGGLLNFITSHSQKVSDAKPEHHDKIAELKGHLRSGDHESALEALHNHPLGLGNKNALEPIVRNLSASVANSPSNPQALQSSIGYLHGAHKGVEKIRDHASNIFERQPKRKMDHGKLSALKKELDSFQESPQKVFDLADSFSSGAGNYLPGHGGDVGNQLATTLNYLNSIKPLPHNAGPLDQPMKPSANQERLYNRALDIAEDPASVIHFAKDGVLEPQDLVTLHTIYPKVAQSIMSEATNTMLEKKSLTLKEKRTVSALLGQPLFYSQTPQSCQAIMQANAQEPSPAPQGPGKKKSSGKATAAELKQIDDVNKLYATPLQERQIDHKD